ncbi:polysaccharide deacetylase family protein [Planctomycetota bacterium]
MPRRFKDLIKFVCAVISAVVLRLAGKPQPRVVLYYHGVDKVCVDHFRQQMAYLTRECLVVKPCDICTMSSEGSKTIVAVTFDDAFVSVLTNAVPILREYDLPAAIFVPTGYIGQSPGWAMAPDCPDKNETVMNEQQIAELDKEGFEILSHTVTHAKLTDLDDSDLETELNKSKQHLEQILGHDVSAVSYPHGAYDARIHEAALKAGYTLGYTISPKVVDHCPDPLCIGRFKVLPHDSLAVFKLKANGAYRISKPLMRLKMMFVRTKQGEGK